LRAERGGERFRQWRWQLGSHRRHAQTRCASRGWGARYFGSVRRRGLACGRGGGGEERDKHRLTGQRESRVGTTEVSQVELVVEDRTHRNITGGFCACKVEKTYTKEGGKWNVCPLAQPFLVEKLSRLEWTWTHTLATRVPMGRYQLHVDI